MVTNTAPQHIYPHHANWRHDVEMEFQLMGERAWRAQDDEDCGMGPLLDLMLQAYFEKDDHGSSDKN